MRLQRPMVCCVATTPASAPAGSHWPSKQLPLSLCSTRTMSGPLTAMLS